MDATKLQQLTGCSPQRAVIYAEPLTAALLEFHIGTPERQAAFLAQIGHESGGLRFSREIWGPTPAQLRYEGRRDLGNVVKGDGERYKGRGLIQITGRAGYQAVSKGLGFDFVGDPDALEEPEMAAASAAWWWSEHGCNQLADAGDFPAITKRINGGMNGYADRFARWEVAKRGLGL